MRRENIVKNTMGIIFLATPHRGANLATILDRILKVTFRHRKFVGDLRKSSETISRINDVFAHLADKLEIYSFWESKGIGSIGVHSPSL